MGAQTNELLNIYESFAMGENPLGKATTIKQQGHDRHQARCSPARQHKIMEGMRNTNKGLHQACARQDLERVHCAFGPATARTMIYLRLAPPTNPLGGEGVVAAVAPAAANGRSKTNSNICYDNEVAMLV